ncbi:MAG TPA: MBL fold metallo-hydrolase, partial [Bdellovibrio sp.]
HSADTKILIDCGLFQGLKVLRLLNWEPLPFTARDIEAVVLTHAHLDHCGALPLLVKAGFRGRIYCTPATLELTKIILLDSAKIQEEEADYANRKRFSKHTPALPLYTTEDVENVFAHLHAVPLHEAFAIKHIQVCLYGAGHILGASSVEIKAEGKTLYFSGDLGRQADPLMWPPEAPPQADAIIMESTYGNRSHSEKTSREVLRECILEVSKNQGVLLIPSFSVGRAQNLAHEIVQLKNEGAVDANIPVYFNSPMGMEANRLYEEYPEFHRLAPGAFNTLMDQVHEVRNAEESKALNESLQRPLIIIAASGMMTGGRVLHHVRAFAGDPKNILLLAGFQAAGTRGRDLVDGKTEIKIHGALRKVNCKVIASDSFSAHADQDELIKWLASAPTKPKKIFLVHGEPEALNTLSEKLQSQFNVDVQIPEMNGSIRL